MMGCVRLVTMERGLVRLAHAINTRWAQRQSSAIVRQSSSSNATKEFFERGISCAFHRHRRASRKKICLLLWGVVSTATVLRMLSYSSKWKPACAKYQYIWAFRNLRPSNVMLLTLSRLTTYIYIWRTAQLTSRCCILNIYSTNSRTENFKHTA
jgi:hypothetical protein